MTFAIVAVNGAPFDVVELTGTVIRTGCTSKEAVWANAMLVADTRAMQRATRTRLKTTPVLLVRLVVWLAILRIVVWFGDLG